MKNTSLEIQLWGMIVGHIAKTRSGIAFEYDEAFKVRGLEISPFEIPLASTHIYQSLQRSQTYSGLPGVIADCLPDTYGRSAINTFYKKNYGLESFDVGPLEILSYIGDRSIGALEFRPQRSVHTTDGDFLEIRNLLSSARLILEGKADEVTERIIRISSSAGGRQAKALIDYNYKTKEIRAGFDPSKQGFRPCIIKFDGLMEGDEANYYGRLEYLYSMLARELGIKMPSTYLLETENDRGLMAHFIIDRFDRDSGKRKTHHFASLCGLTLRDYRDKHSSSYEDYLRVAMKLTSAQSEVYEAFQRAIFNLVFRVQDDHSKNFGFLMDQKGQWTLSPAYDLTYVFGGTALTHQMTFNGKDDLFECSDVIEVGKKFGIKKAQAMHVLENTLATASQFESRALEVGLEEDYIKGVSSRLRKTWA